MMFKKRLKIAIIAPSFGQMGGPEVATTNTAHALYDAGADVTLFAPGDWSGIRCKHIVTLPKSLWNTKDFIVQSPLFRRNLIISSQLEVAKYQDQFDIIHLNSQSYAYSVAKMLHVPCILTLHNRINRQEYNQIRSAGVKIVSITKDQKTTKNHFRIATYATIPNSLPLERIEPSFDKGKYLIAVGRLTDQKGIDIAIQVAKRAGKKLLIFGRIGNSPERQKYFHEILEPEIDNKSIVYKGEVSHDKIYHYLRGAEALLFTIRRPEAFGLVMIEALACGTPVIGTRISPIPEVVKGSRVCCVSDDVDELVDAAIHTERFDRRACRKYVKNRYTDEIVARKYLDLYRKILNI